MISNTFCAHFSTQDDLACAWIVRRSDQAQIETSAETSVSPIVNYLEQKLKISFVIPKLEVRAVAGNAAQRPKNGQACEHYE